MMERVEMSFLHRERRWDILEITVETVSEYNVLLKNFWTFALEWASRQKNL